MSKASEATTPRPWSAEQHHIWRVYHDGQGRRCHQPIAEVHAIIRHEDEQLPNAALIVEAVNGWEGLVAERDSLRARRDELADCNVRLAIENTKLLDEREKLVTDYNTVLVVNADLVKALRDCKARRRKK